MSHEVPPARTDRADAPSLRFLSLFVPDLAAAQRVYEQVLGVPPRSPSGVPAPHPFAAAGPVVFDLGGVKLALYQCDMRTTHPGDVGIGLWVDGSPTDVARRATSQGGRAFAPEPLPAGDGQQMAVFVLPDRHFFEVLGPR